MRLVGYPKEKISMLTTYNGQKALLHDVAERRCAHHPAFGMPHQVHYTHSEPLLGVKTQSQPPPGMPHQVHYTHSDPPLGVNTQSQPPPLTCPIRYSTLILTPPAGMPR